MFRVDFAKQVAIKTGTSLEEATRDVNTILDVITEELGKGGEVKIVGFGVFKVVHAAAKKGYIHSRQMYVDIPECDKPVFKPGKAFKEYIKEIPD